MTESTTINAQIKELEKKVQQLELALQQQSQQNQQLELALQQQSQISGQVLKVLDDQQQQLDAIIGRRASSSEIPPPSPVIVTENVPTDSVRSLEQLEKIKPDLNSATYEELLSIPGITEQQASNLIKEKEKYKKGFKFWKGQVDEALLGCPIAVNTLKKYYRVQPRKGK